MRVSKCFGLLAAVLLIGGSALAQAPYVYVSNPDEDAIFAVDPATSAIALVYYEEGSNYEDLVVGPDELLYACDPSNRRIIRIDVSVNPADTEVVYEGGGYAFQCGWFKNNGDFFVSDTAGAGVFSCAGLAKMEFGSAFCAFAPGDHGGQPRLRGPGSHPDRDRRPAGGGPGRRQPVVARDRSLLRSVLSVGGVGADLRPRHPGRCGAVGRRRDLRGHRRRANAVCRGRQRDRECDEGFGRRDVPFFLDFAADDTLYVATTRNNAGILWQMATDGCDCDADTGNIPDCVASQVFVFNRQSGYEPTAVGVAVPLTTDLIKATKDLASTATSCSASRTTPTS